MLDEYDRITKYNTEMIYVSPEDADHTRDFIGKTKKEAPFPVVIDEKREVVKAYRLEKPTEKQVEVIPSIYLIDQKGTLRFKYVAQDPFDRPPIEHLEEMLGVINGTR